MTPIHNPILPGFNPDPSIVRVGNDFYLATSTFEWYPGVQIWHSRDLAQWRLVTRPLAERRLLDMTGVPSSGGIWAPCLSYNRGLFYLVFTTVHVWKGEAQHDIGTFKDSPNFVVTAQQIDGPWSEPIALHSRGFDPSLFHDADGRSWLASMEWDYRGTPSFFSGILLQEFDTTSGSLIGPVHSIFTGTRLDCTEGPHLYRRNDWYYLMVAEGGTSYEHAITVARSRSLTGPYEVHPSRPFISGFESYDRDVDALHQAVQDSAGLGFPVRKSALPPGFYQRPQKAGHGSMCAVTGNQWALVHLCGRPIPGTTACPLGRETSIQRVLWRDDDWPYVVDGSGTPVQIAQSTTGFTGVPAGDQSNPTSGHSQDAQAMVAANHVVSDHFRGARLHPTFRWLRSPIESDRSLTARPGFLRLIGRESPVSTFRQTVIATAATAAAYVVETGLEFAPDSFQQMAGLMVRYDERNQYYLRVSQGDAGKRTLGIVVIASGRVSLPLTTEIALPAGPVRLGLVSRGAIGQFYLLQADAPPDWYREPNEAGADPVGDGLDMLLLSDERVWPMGFSGTFVGMACHDMTGGGIAADFSHFRYEPIPYETEGMLATLARSTSSGSTVKP